MSNSNNTEYATLDYVKIEAKLKVIVSMLSICSKLYCFGISYQKKVKHVTQLKKSIQLLIRMWQFFVSFCDFHYIIQGFAGSAAYHQNIIRRY